MSLKLLYFSTDSEMGKLLALENITFMNHWVIESLSQ
jgi:hypothetical protein